MAFGNLHCYSIGERLKYNGGFLSILSLPKLGSILIGKLLLTVKLYMWKCNRIMPIKGKVKQFEYYPIYEADCLIYMTACD